MGKHSIEELNSILQRTNAFGEKWTTVSKIGQGRYSEVFKIQRRTGETVEESALKWIYVSARNENLTAADQRTHFAKLKQKCSHELEIMIRLKGEPSIVRYENYSIEEDEDGLGFSIFLQMELLQSLRQYCAENSLRIRDVAEIGKQIARACSLLQREKIVHGDIKPENIFVTRDGKQYKLGDFGIATSPDSFGFKQKHRGTEGYIAPEVMNKGLVDYSCDQYSLGIVLYELLNEGEIPDEGNRGEDGIFPTPRYGDDELDSIIVRMCHAERTYRFEDATTVEEQFDRLLKRSDARWLQKICEGALISERETRTDMPSNFANADNKDKVRLILPIEEVGEAKKQDEEILNGESSEISEKDQQLSEKIWGNTKQGQKNALNRVREKRRKNMKIAVAAVFLLFGMVGSIFLFRKPVLVIQFLTADMDGRQCVVEWVSNGESEWEVVLFDTKNQIVDQLTTTSNECVFDNVYPGEYLIVVRDDAKEAAAQIDFVCHFKEVSGRIDMIYLVQYPMKHRESGLGRKYIVSLERQEECVTYETTKMIDEQPFGYAIKLEHDYIVSGTLCLRGNGVEVYQEWQSESNADSIWIDITEMLEKTGKQNKEATKLQLLVYGDGEIYEELEFNVAFR